MRRLVCDLLLLYWVVLLIRVLSSWFPRPMSGPLLTVWNAIHAVTDPVLRPLRGLIPPLRAGAMAMDFTPVLAFVILLVLIRAIC
jgi:YggT family protein